VTTGLFVNAVIAVFFNAHIKYNWELNIGFGVFDSFNLKRLNGQRLPPCLGHEKTRRVATAGFQSSPLEGLLTCQLIRS
jgi:hypothetical protein